MRLILTLVLGVLLGSPALAQNAWIKNGIGTVGVTTATPGSTYRFRSDDSETDSTIIDVRACENLDMVVTADRDGDATGDVAAVWTPESCPFANSTLGGATPTTVFTETERGLACVDFPGSAITNTGMVQGMGTGTGWFRVNVTTPHTNDPELWLKCNGPGN